MLRASRMKKIRIVALQDYRYDLIRRLHELGVIQLTNLTEKLSNPDWSNLLNRGQTDPIVRKITTLFMEYGHILDLFQTVQPEDDSKGGFVGGFMGWVKKLLAPIPPKSILVKDSFGEELIKESEELLENVKKEISDPEAKYFELDEKILEREEKKILLEKIKSLDIELSQVGDGEFHQFWRNGLTENR